MAKFSFYFLFGFVFLAASAPSPSFSSKEEPATSERIVIAMMAVQNPRTPLAHLSKLKSSMASALEQEMGSVSLHQDEIGRALEETFPKILREETKRARDAYYHFRFEEAKNLLEGRLDEDALKVLLLIEWALDSQNSTRIENTYRQILKIHPRFLPSSQEYPPQLVARLSRFRKPEKPELSNPSLLGTTPIPEDLSPRQSSWGSWKLRLQKLAQEKNWDQILLCTMEPIGWNYKIRGILIPSHGEEKIKTVELVNIREISKASKILVKSLFFGQNAF